MNLIFKKQNKQYSSMKCSTYKLMYLTASFRKCYHNNQLTFLYFYMNGYACFDDNMWKLGLKGIIKLVSEMGKT